MNCNQELYNLLSDLHLAGDDRFLEKIQPLKDFLASQGSGVSDQTTEKAKILCDYLRTSNDSCITAEGPPSLTEITKVAKRQLLYAEQIKRIQSIKDDEDIKPNDLGYLNDFFENEHETYAYKLQKFLDDTSLARNQFTEILFNDLAYRAQNKKTRIETLTKTRSEERVNVLKLSINAKQNKLQQVFASIKDDQVKILTTLNEINQKKLEIESILQQLDADLKDHLKRSLKEETQKQIDNHNEQTRLLNFTVFKLEQIEYRLRHRLDKAQENLRRDFFAVYNKITAEEDAVISGDAFDTKMVPYDLNYIDNEDPTRFCFYQIEGKKFKYKVKNPDNTRDYGEIEFDADIDINAEETKNDILNEFVERGYIAHKKYKPYTLGKPEVGVAADEKRVESLAMVLNDLEKDVARCHRAIHLAELTAVNPAKQLHAKLSANTFMDVMSLADITLFNSAKKPFFRDEIIDAKTHKSLQEDPRVKFGLEGEVITRGVMLKPGEVVRSSCIIDSTNKIIIDTKFVKSKLTGEHSIAKLEMSWKGNLSQEQKKEAAFRYARKLLLQYTEGDSKSKITIKAGRKQSPEDAKEQANMVYAAILMLTSKETAGEDCIDLPSDKLRIEVKGVGPDLFSTWPWDRTRDFIEQHFENQTENRAMRKQVTTEYRTLRKGINRDNKKAIIDDRAVDDVQHNSALFPKK